MRIYVRDLSDFVEDAVDTAKMRLGYVFNGGVDALTGFKNDEWKRAHRSLETSTVKIFIDLNGLKSVNEKFGHRAGDLFIQTFAGRISSFCKKYGFTPIRLHGDEFLLVSRRPQSGWIKALSELRRSSRNECPFAYGTGITTAEAEKEMRADKDEQYRLQGVDRRTDSRRCFDKVVDRFESFSFEDVKVKAS
jgi:diguanylate cyclase (GGDEF)-like protein